MKLITKDTDHAITTLILLTRGEGRLRSASELARELGISHSFLRKILRILAGKEIVRSRNGEGGGFALLRNPRNISVLDIVEIFQGPVRFNDCMIGNRPCERADHCVLRGKLKSMESRLLSDLTGITIASLVEEQAASGRKKKTRRRNAEQTDQ